VASKVVTRLSNQEPKQQGPKREWFNPEKHLCKLLAKEYCNVYHLSSSAANTSRPSLMRSILFPASGQTPSTRNSDQLAWQHEDPSSGVHNSNATPQRPPSHAQSRPLPPNQCPSYESVIASGNSGTGQRRDPALPNTMMDPTLFDPSNRDLDEMMDPTLVDLSTRYLDGMMDLGSPRPNGELAGIYPHNSPWLILYSSTPVKCTRSCPNHLFQAYTIPAS